MIPTTTVLRSVVDERRRQDRMWGEQDHDFGGWLAIFQEELGEACRAQMEMRYRPAHLRSVREQQAAHIRKELVQAIAVLVAMVECGDRRGWFKCPRRFIACTRRCYAC